MRRLLLALLLVLAPAPAWAAWAFVGGGINTTLAGTSQTITRSVTSGNLICVGGFSTSTSDTLSISDSVNTWRQIGSQLNDTTNSQTTTWWCAVAATTASVTATVTSGNFSSVGAFWFGEWSGSASGDTRDGGTQNGVFVNSTGSSATDGDTSGSITPASDGDLIISWITDPQGIPTGQQFTAGTGFTRRTAISNDNPGVTLVFDVEDLVQGSHASIAGTWTAQNTNSYGALVGAFKAAASGKFFRDAADMTGTGTGGPFFRTVPE